MPKKKEIPLIHYAKLDPRVVDGYCFDDGVIILATGLSPKRRITVAVHEMLHRLDWNKSEHQVTKEAEAIGEFLFANGFRYVAPKKKNKVP